MMSEMTTEKYAEEFDAVGRALADAVENRSAIVVIEAATRLVLASCSALRSDPRLAMELFMKASSRIMETDMIPIFQAVRRAVGDEESAAAVDGAVTKVRVASTREGAMAAARDIRSELAGEGFAPAAAAAAANDASVVILTGNQPAPEDSIKLFESTPEELNRIAGNVARALGGERASDAILAAMGMAAQYCSFMAPDPKSALLMFDAAAANMRAEIGGLFDKVKQSMGENLAGMKPAGHA